MSNITWFKIDDGFWSHPKVIELPDAAVALWVKAGAYAAQHLTDGLVTGGTLRMLGADDSAASALVEVGLWDADERGYQFHDWHEYQPTREKVLADRDAAAERMRKRRANTADSSQDVRPNTRRTFARSSATPTRPDPTRTSNEVPPPAAPDLSTLFEKAYFHWPKKIERKQALERFEKAAKKVGAETLAGHVERFGQAYARTTEKQFVPALGVWLNGERWTDELPGAGKTKGGGTDWALRM